MIQTRLASAGTRISTLVSAAKQYSQMDRASHQWIDVHDGLKSTVVMLTHKLGDRIRVVKDFDRTLVIYWKSCIPHGYPLPDAAETQSATSTARD